VILTILLRYGKENQEILMSLEKNILHYQGQPVTVNGKKMNLAAWLNVEKTKEGQPDISLKISELIMPKEDAPF
jgi:hypothetical protein